MLLVDDHQMVADALSQVLSREPDIEVVGVAGSVAMARSFATQPIDVVLLDYRLPDGTGSEAARAIKERRRGVRIIMLTGLSDDETILESIRAGADGYITKDSAIRDLVQAVRAAHAGETLLPPEVLVEIARRVAQARDEPADHRSVEKLTSRELEVLRALTEGRTSPEICERLSITPNTLRTHVGNVLAKLGVHSKLEAVAFALRHGLVEPPRLEDQRG